MRLKIRVADASHILRDLRKLAEAGKLASDETVRAIAEDVLELAKEGMIAGAGPSAPGQPPHVDTGKLKGSLKMIVRKRGERTRANVGTDLPEGYWLEFGTSRMAARPWLLPAFEEASIRAEGQAMNQMRAAL